MTKEQFEQINLPDAPGVYFFKDSTQKILYIGRATSLRDRVRSYFSDDLIATRGPLLVDMVTQAETITFEETGSVLEAIILESNLIKQHQPYYNTKEKDNKSYSFVVITNEELPRIITIRGRNLAMFKENSLDVGYPIKHVFGPFPYGSLMREALSIIRKIFPFRDEKALQKSHDTFYQTLGLSPKITDEASRAAYFETLRHIKLFFEGKSHALRSELEENMKQAAAQENFEEAARIRKQLFALSHIEDIALIKAELSRAHSPNGSGDHNENTPYRIEAYDIAHTSGSEVVGGMVVSHDGELLKSEYRKFKMSRNVNDDIGNLQELLVRRLRHSEWPLPQLIVIDGGKTQLAAAYDVCKRMNIPVNIVSVLKDDAHKGVEILTAPEAQYPQEYTRHIFEINAEVHRYALHYHKYLRRNASLGKKVADHVKAVKKKARQE